MTFETIDIVIIENTKYKINWVFIYRKFFEYSKYLKFYERILKDLKISILKFYKNFLRGLKYE